jgi:hypothetical protein
MENAFRYNHRSCEAIFPVLADRFATQLSAAA